MKVGEVLNGYKITTPPTNAGGGMSQWSFATRGDNEYFVKMFLAPKYPLADGPGSDAAKARKRNVCLEFERRHLEIAGRLDPEEPGSGNLVVPCDFFRVDSTYVKVMERVQIADVPPAHCLTPHQLIVILRTLVFSLRVLHGKEIVHGDIKPDNVLLSSVSEGIYVSKLIDFDEAYVVGRPPQPQNIVGDPVYYSPEVLWYIKSDDIGGGDILSTASDIFSLGLLIHCVLAGDVPGFDRDEARYPAEAMLAGRTLDVAAAPEVVRPLLADMLAMRPDDRPEIGDVIDVLTKVDPVQLIPTTAPTRRARVVPRVEPPPPRATATTGPAPAPAPAKVASTLRGSLGAVAHTTESSVLARSEAGAGPSVPAVLGGATAPPREADRSSDHDADRTAMEGSALRISIGRRKAGPPK